MTKQQMNLVCYMAQPLHVMFTRFSGYAGAFTKIGLHPVAYQISTFWPKSIWTGLEWLVVEFCCLMEQSSWKKLWVVPLKPEIYLLVDRQETSPKWQQHKKNIFVIVVVVISDFLERYSKAKCTMAPVYPRVLRQINGVVQRVVRGKLGFDFQTVRAVKGCHLYWEGGWSEWVGVRVFKEMKF